MANIFQVKLDDYILYDYRTEDLKIFNPKLSLEKNTTGSFTFTIYNDHLYFGNINKLKSIVKVYQDEKLIFRGRVLEDKENLYKAKDVECEGELSFLLDSIYRPFDLTNKTVSIKEFFTELITNHNSQVQDFQKFILGDITVEDENEKINFSSDSALKTWEVIKTRLLEIYGGYLYITYNEEEMPILHYLKEVPNTAIQTIEFEKNMIDISNLISGSEIATAVMPFGAKLKDANGNETGERLTIKSVNNDIDYICDEEMVKQYGFIFLDPTKSVFDDITQATNLLNKAKELLADSVKLSSTIELKAVDLSNVYDIQAFHFLDNIKILSLYHNIDKVYVLEKIDIELFNPENTIITLGETYKTLTDTSKETSSIINRIDIVEKDYVKNKNVGAIVDENIKNSTVISQTAEEVVLGAMQEYVKETTFDTFKETNSSELQLLAEQIIANFTSTTSSIENVDGELKQVYEKIVSWIRGYQNNEGQPVIELGDGQSTIKLKLENDEIYFEINGVKRFYLNSQGELVFENAIFKKSAQVGNGFGFVERSNGNLSFKKVVK